MRPLGLVPEVGAKLARALRTISGSMAGTAPWLTVRSLLISSRCDAVGPGWSRLSSSTTSPVEITDGSDVRAVHALRREPSEMRVWTLLVVASSSSNDGAWITSPCVLGWVPQLETNPVQPILASAPCFVG